MEFKNPLAPPPLNQQTSNKPLDTANRALYSNLELLFTKVDTWGLPYYHKYLGAYTALQYYLYVFRLTSQVASSLVTQLESESNSSVTGFDNALSSSSVATAVPGVVVQGPPVKLEHVSYLNQLKSASGGHLDLLLTLIVQKAALYPSEPLNDSSNVRAVLYNSFKTNVNNALRSYLNNDSQYSAVVTRNSMELLFGELLSTLEPYRSYFTSNALEQLYTFSELQARVSNVSYDSEQAQGGVLLANVLRSRGLQELPYSNNKNWSSEFLGAYTKVTGVTSKYVSTSYSNVLYSSVSNVSSTRNSTNSNLLRSNTSFSFKVTLVGTTLQFKEQEPVEYTPSQLVGRYVNYYDRTNVKRYAKVESFQNNSFTLDPPVESLSEQSPYLSFSLVPTGCNVETTFPPSVKYTSSTRKVCGFTLTKLGNKPTNVFSGEVTFNDSLFNNNVLRASNTSDTLRFLTYNSNTEEITSNFTPSGTAKFSLSKEGNWVSLTKKQLQLSNGTTANQSVHGSGLCTYFESSTPGTKYFSVEVPLEDTHFTNEVQFYVVKKVNSSVDNVRYLQALSTTSSTVDGLTKLSATFNLSDSNFNKDTPFRGGTPVNVKTTFYVVLHVKSKEVNSNKLRFNNLYVSESQLANTYTFTSLDDYVKKLYNSTNSNVWTRYLNFVKVGNSLKLTTEPKYLGSSYMLTVSNGNTLYATSTTTTGVDPVNLTPSGREKKFYDNFVGYLKELFLLLNNYALARLVVPEAFEDETYFNNDKVVTVGKEELKGLRSDLLEDLGLTPQEYADKLYADPRAKLVQQTSPAQDFPREVLWQSGSLGSLLPQSQLEQIRSSLQKVKSAVKKVRSVLEAIRSFIEVLSALSELADNLIGAALDTVINQLQKVLDNVASTGVYFLPLWDYYRTEDAWSWLFGANVATVNGTLNQLLQENNPGFDEVDVLNNLNYAVYQKAQTSYTQNFYSDLYETNRLIYEGDSVTTQSAAGTSSSTVKSWYDSFLPFRATSYEEFVTLVVSCFLDPYDKPLATDFDFTKVGIKNYVVGGNVLQVGAPRFGTGSQMEVFVGALTLPDPELSRAAGTAFATVLLKVISAVITLWDAVKKPKLSIQKEDVFSLYSSAKTVEDFKKAVKKKFDYLNQFSSLKGLREVEFTLRTYLYGVSQQSAGEEPGEFVESGLSGAGETGNQLVKKWKKEGNFNTADYLQSQNSVFAEPPNFIGVSLASLFPGVFTLLNYLVDRLRKFNEDKEEPSLSEFFEEILDWFDDTLQEIDDLLYLVEKITELIDAILGISLTYLRVSTTKGVEDFVAQLEGASGFPNEDSSQVILGFVGVVGFPSPDDPALNLSEYFSEVSKEFNDEAADLLSDLKLQNEGEGLGFLNKILPNSNK